MKGLKPDIPGHGMMKSGEAGKTVWLDRLDTQIDTKR